MTLRYLTGTNANGVSISSVTYKFLHQDVTTLVDVCHRAATAAGWWDKERNVPEALCLIHSEISEAMEGHRRGLVDQHIPTRPSIAVELADALIRIFDLAGGLELDLGGAFAEKLHYNQTREDHKREVRAAEGGKKY